MNHYSKFIYQLKEKILNYSIKITKGLSLPDKKFITDMFYGLNSSCTVIISDIARSLKENITLKKTVERLSRNICEFDNRDTIYNNYLEEIKDDIEEDTIFPVDFSEIVKPMSSKMEYLSTVHDGSTGRYEKGYGIIEIAAISSKNKLPVSVYSEIYSSEEKGFVSVNEECFKAIDKLQGRFGKVGIYALDRGFDDIKYIEYFSGNKLNFVIRMTTKRNVIIKEKETNILKVANRVKPICEYNYKDKDGITRHAKVGYKKVRLPDLAEEVFYLVVIKNNVYDKPMMLLTNIPATSPEMTRIVNKAYIQRWKIEEYFKFKKQQYSFEKIRVMTINGIRNINMILSILIGMIMKVAEKGNSLEYKVIFKASKSLRKDMVLVYYAIANGIREILKTTFKGINQFYRKSESTNSEQLILLQFSNINCFTESTA